MTPARYRRTDRVAALVLREVTRIVREEVRDPRIGFVTFTGADVSPDLASGRVFVSVMGAEAQKGESLAGLRSAAPFIRKRLWELLDLRTVPELAFELDRTLEHAARIESILDRIQEERGNEAGGAAQDEPGEPAEAEPASAPEGGEAKDGPAADPHAGGAARDSG